MNETPQQYAQRVVGYLEGRDPVEVLASTPRELQKLIKGASKRKLGAKPVPDGWSAAMILGHMADTEIVYAFRLRLMLGTRGITIQGIDQDAWAVIFDYSTQDAVASVEDF